MKKANLALLLAATPALAQTHARFAVTDLGTLGNFDAAATAISNTGHIVGFANNPASGYDRAVRWDPTPSVITGEGVSGAFAFGVNDAGLIVGSSDSLSFHAYAFDGILHDLGGGIGAGLGVNNAGVIVGRSNDIHGFSHAVRWDNFVRSPLPEFGGFGSVANAINENGVIAGSSDLPNNLGLPCIWNSTGIHALPVETSSFAEALSINERNQAVGYSYTSTGTVGFLSDGVTTVNLGTLGNSVSYGRSINNRAQVVGQSYTAFPGAVVHAFLWERGRMRDLNALIPASSGWILNDAPGIADDGRIVGTGYFNGQAHAFLLTPTCPADLDDGSGTGAPDGVVNVADFLHFIRAYAAGDPAADTDDGTSRGLSDARISIQDFLYYLAQYSRGC